ncbi:MAG: hypothetical protein GY760_07705 [Deltaproteobacteria bacterium]|nr:hypothetical protein [Deltaproteobacteria bacterium]
MEKHKNQVLQGHIGEKEFVFKSGYALKNLFDPRNKWTILLYGYEVEYDKINIGKSDENDNYPNISFSVQKDSDYKFYDINKIGVYDSGRKGTIATGWQNKTSASVFESGELEIIGTDLKKKKLTARMWAKTKDGKSEINGEFIIDIKGSSNRLNTNLFENKVLQGSVNNNEFNFKSGFALSVDDEWQVLLYNVYKPFIDLSNSSENYPNVTFSIKKNLVNKYDINVLGVNVEKENATVVRCFFNITDNVIFEDGELEIVEVDEDKGIIKAKIWAETHDGVSFLNGGFQIDIFKEYDDKILTVTSESIN